MPLSFPRTLFSARHHWRVVAALGCGLGLSAGMAPAWAQGSPAAAAATAGTPRLVTAASEPPLPLQGLSCTVALGEDGKGDSPGGGRTTMQIAPDLSLVGGAAQAAPAAFGTLRREVRYRVNVPNVTALVPPAWGRLETRSARLRIQAGADAGAPEVASVLVRFHGDSRSASVASRALEPVGAAGRSLWRVQLRSEGRLLVGSTQTRKSVVLVATCELPVQGP